VDPAIAQRLDAINARFYEDFAEEFSASRTRLNAGIERVLDGMVPLGSVLDLGCGNARLGRAWASGRFPGPMRYTGVDRSARLLAVHPAAPGMRLVDLAVGAQGWEQALRVRVPEAVEGFDRIVCFAVLHHLPDRRRRVATLAALRSLLRPNGRWAVSVWQFLHVPRLRDRVVDWTEAGLRGDEVEGGDLLMDWRRGGRGLRYVHHYEPSELLADCQAAGLQVHAHFASDGESGDLGLYVTGW
jgi:tRNA (uracil-5-)-methyltransferase TRM9